MSILGRLSLVRLGAKEAPNNFRFIDACLVNAGASDKLDAAVAAADSSYNGSLAVTIYVEEARNENS